MNTEPLLGQDFDENGYIVIKNAFTEEEIDKICSAKHQSPAIRVSKLHWYFINNSIAFDCK